MLRRNFSEEQKQQYIEEFKNSNMSLTAYCKKIGIARQTMGPWLNKDKSSTVNNFGAIQLKNIQSDVDFQTETKKDIFFSSKYIKIELKEGFNKLILKKIVEVLTVD